MKFLKQALQYIAPFKGHLALILLFNILYSIFSIFSLTMVVPFLSVLFGEEGGVLIRPELSLNPDAIIQTFYYYMGVIIDRYGQLHALIYIAVTMILFSLLSNLFRYLGHYCMASIRAGMLKTIRQDIYHKLLILPLSFYSKFKKGDIMNRIGSDVQEVEWSIISSIQIFCRDPFLLLFSLIMLLSVNFKLTIITLLILPVSGVLIAGIGKLIKRYSIRSQEILGAISAKFEESISGLRIIKGYNAIDYASEEFKKENDYFARLNTKIYRINDLGAPLIEFLSILSMIMILLIGGQFVLEESIFSGGIFVMYIIIFARMLPPAKQLATAHYTIQKGKASVNRINDILESDEIITEVANPVPVQEWQETIEYRDVSFRYLNIPGIPDTIDDGADVLRNINLQINKGDVVALVGPSGAGKSTMVDLLPRFYDTTRGGIFIDNTNIKNFKIKDLRDLFGIVSQDVILFNDTIFNNIAFGQKNITKEMVIEAARLSHAHDFIMEMENGYETIIGDRGAKLSGGQRQRLSIARTLLKNPPILIFDEATSALDTESEYIVQQSIENLLNERTAIIIAHRLSTIRHADKIIFLEKGAIIEEGSHEELIEKKGAYFKFYTLQEL